MDFDIGVFRETFPEFNNSTKYPQSQIEFWAGLGELLIRPSIWKNAWQQGMSLYVAHQITLAAQNAKAASVGGTPGQQGGIANTKTVGGATIGFDSQSSSYTDAGWWNLTTYGKQFWSLIKIFGAGAVQL